MSFDRIETLDVPVSDGTRRMHLWIPGEKPRAAVLLIHGMAEHIMRYDGTARALCGRGFLAAGADLRGHGPDCPKEKLGYFADRDGWDVLLDDILREDEALRARYPGVPLVLLGHSMGSFLAREYALRHGSGLSALILSGTGKYPEKELQAGLLLSRLLPPGKPSPLLDRLSFSGNIRPFASARTKFDWLSRDEAVVDRYLKDPLCGFVFTARAFGDFFAGMLRLSDEARSLQAPKDLPVLFISGRMDPVGQMGRGVEAVAASCRARGMKKVEVHIYPGARHEILNETNRSDVIGDVCRFIEDLL